MRITGWIITVIGYVIALSGVTRCFAGGMHAMPRDNGTHMVLGALTVGVAWLLIKGGGKLRAKANKASA
ncbi:hypothetical protein V476_19110 [Pseudomonas syringae KCTC 12500]|nr:hypothetical protein V476_19110 [Pseudomonas syringae KCTC 12500]